MVVVHPDDVALLEIFDDSVCEALVYGHVVRIGLGRAECIDIGFRRVGHGVVQARPQDLMAELVVAFLELAIGDPRRQAALLQVHAMVDIFPYFLAKAVGRCTKGAHPEFSLHAVADALHSVFKAAVAMGVRFHVPSVNRLIEDRRCRPRVGGTRAARQRTAGALLAAQARRRLVVGVCSLMLAGCRRCLGLQCKPRRFGGGERVRGLCRG